MSRSRSCTKPASLTIITDHSGRLDNEHASMLRNLEDSKGIMLDQNLRQDPSIVES